MLTFVSSGNEDILLAVDNLRNDLALQEIRRMRRLLDCWHTNNRTQIECSTFKRDVIQYYNRTGKTDRRGLIISARCMVSDRLCDYADLCPAHLVKHKSPELMSLYGLNPADVDSPRNGILVLKEIELAFDHKDVCFLCAVTTTGYLHLRVLNPTLRTKRIYPSSPNDQRTFDDVDNSVLRCPKRVYPYRRILSMHAKLSFSRALSRGWIQDSAVLDTYFNISQAGLLEPECMRTLTWKQVNYAEIEKTLT